MLSVAYGLMLLFVIFSVLKKGLVIVSLDK